MRLIGHYRETLSCVDEPKPVTEGFSVVIPAYNEEQGIEQVLQQLCAALNDCPVPYEIIVVDDGSRDKTAAILGNFQGIRLISHPVNKGYGAALKTGIRFARHNLICITDADGTYPNERIFELIDHMQHHHTDMIVGARIGKRVHIPLVRRPAKWFIARLADFVCDQHIPDLNSGFRVFRRQSVLPFWNMLPNGFSFTTTITLCMLTNAYLVEYVPIDYHIRNGRSKIRPMRDTINFLRLIMHIALLFNPLKIFIPLSLILLMTAVVAGLYTHLVIGKLADMTTAIIALTGVQCAMLGLLAELITQRVPGIGHLDDEHIHRP